MNIIAKSKRGLTLVELIITMGLIAIIGVGAIMMTNTMLSTSNNARTMSDYQQTSKYVKNMLMEKLQFSGYLGVVDESSVGMPDDCKYIYTKNGYLYQKTGGTEGLLISEDYYNQVLYDIVFSKSTRESNVLYVNLRAYKRDGTAFKSDLFSIKVLNLVGSYRSIDVLTTNTDHNMVAFK